MNHQRWIIAGMAAAAVLSAGLMLPVSAQPKKTAPVSEKANQVRGDEITEAQRKAVEKGLEFLASRQQPNGAFGAGNSGYQAHTGITSLSGIAFMSAGNLPGRGKYGDNVRKATEFVLNNSQESGLLAADSSHGVMYSHGFAALFLAEVYGMTHDDDLKERLQKSIRLVAKVQNSEGGWRYTPSPQDADISVTITQVMALRAARDAGIKVEKETIDKAIAYVRRCQNADGGFSYQAHGGGGFGGGSAFPRSAAGVATLYYAGIFEGDELKKGLDYLLGFLPKGGGGPGGRMDTGGHFFYGQYYAAQAMFLAGGDYWAKWYPAVRDDLIARQNKNTGSWSGDVSEEFATACALIVLQMPNRYLPVFHGKGPGG